MQTHVVHLRELEHQHLIQMKPFHNPTRVMHEYNLSVIPYISIDVDHTTLKHQGKIPLSHVYTIIDIW